MNTGAVETVGDVFFCDRNSAVNYVLLEAILKF